MHLLHVDRLRQGYGESLRWLERVLIAFGLGCLLFYAIVTIQTANYQRRGVDSASFSRAR